jgi:hypothetical protein
MSLDFLCDLERIIESGKEVFACPGVGDGKWMISKSQDDVKRQALRLANSRKQSVDVVKLVPKGEVLPGEMYLVPVAIDQIGPRGEPNISWRAVESKEAAELMRDVKEGPSPYFGIQVWEKAAPQ